MRGATLWAAGALAIAASAGGAARAGGACDAWTVVPSPDISKTGDNTFASVAGRNSDDVWAVGQYIPDGRPNVTRTFAAHYDGKAWSAIPSPNVGRQANALHHVAVAATGQAWAVGYAIDETAFVSHTLILAWDGAAWRVVPHPADPGVAAVLFGVAAHSASDVWAVGEYEQPIDRFHTLIEHFDGRAWAIEPSPDPGETGDILYGVTTRGRAVFAVGERTSDASPDRALILALRGGRWTALEPPPADGDATTRLYGAATDASGALHAAGEAEDDPENTFALAELGAQGQPLKAQSVEHVGASANHFYGLGAAPDGTAWAVGARFDPASGRQFTLLERAEPGGRWLAARTPSPSRAGDSLLADVAPVGSDVWAVGAFDGPNAQRSLILHSCHYGAPPATMTGR
ncbi:MAG: hypothetical protein ACR2F8_02555 [Caulobacteraceae bacterium]